MRSKSSVTALESTHFLTGAKDALRQRGAVPAGMRGTTFGDAASSRGKYANVVAYQSLD